MELTPLMEAMHKWAMADPEDSDREWDAYLALVKEQGSTSVSSPMSSTSHLHYRARASAAAVMDRSAMHSTEPLRAPSGAASSDYSCDPSPRSTAPLAASASCNLGKDDLSPGARRIYDYLTGATDSFHELAAATLDSTSASVQAAIARHATDICAVPPSTCSIICLGGDTNSTSTPSSPVIVPASSASIPMSPATTLATEDVSTVLQVPMELDTVREVDTNIADLAALTTATCLSDCPSCDLISTTSSNTTGGSLSGHCCFDLEPTVDSPVHVRTSTRAPTVALVDSTPVTVPAMMDLLPVMPSTCLMLGLADSIGAEDPVDVPLAPGSALASFVVSQVLEAMAPHWCLVKCSDEDTCVLMPRFNRALLPWPSFKCSPFWTSLVRSTGIPNIPQLDRRDMLFLPWINLFSLHVKSIEHTRSRIGVHLCCFCSHDAELQVFCFASCRIRYLHGTLNNILLPADWQVLKTVGPKWSAIWFDLREVRYQFTRIIVVKLNPLYKPSLGMCSNLPTGNAASGCHSCAIVGLAPIYLQLEQLTMVKFVSSMYMLAYAATLRHHFSRGHILLFRPAASNSVMPFYFFPDLGMLVVFVPGLEKEQLTARLVVAYVVILPTTQFYSMGMSSWTDALIVLNQGILMSCNLYVLYSFVMELEVYNMVSRLNINQFHWGIFGIKNLLIQWDPGDVQA